MGVGDKCKESPEGSSCLIGAGKSGAGKKTVEEKEGMILIEAVGKEEEEEEVEADCSVVC